MTCLLVYLFTCLLVYLFVIEKSNFWNIVSPSVQGIVGGYEEYVGFVLEGGGALF